MTELIQTGPASSVIRLPIHDQTSVHSGGVDLVDVDRIDLLWQRTGLRLIERICTDGEWNALRAKRVNDHSGGFTDALARCFGVKEAVIKTAHGLPSRGRFSDIDTTALLRPGLAPEAPYPIRLSGVTAEVLAGLELLAGIRRFANLLICWVTATVHPHSTGDSPVVTPTRHPHD